MFLFSFWRSVCGRIQFMAVGERLRTRHALLDCSAKPGARIRINWPRLADALILWGKHAYIATCAHPCHPARSETRPLFSYSKLSELVIALS